MDINLTHIALCAGIGGDTLAANWAGFTTVQLVEKNPFRQAVLRKHWPEVPIEEDINDFKGKQLRGAITLVTAGDPCQPSSLAGKRRGAEDDRYLWPQVFRVVCEVRPAWFVGENPPGRLTMDFYRVLSDLESQGYETRSFIIPACAVNAPHRRDRLYIVAHNDNHRQSRARIPVPERRPQQADADPSRSREAAAYPESGEDDRRKRGKLAEKASRGESGDSPTGISCQDVADTRCGGCKARRPEISLQERESSFNSCCGNAPHSKSKGLEGPEPARTPFSQRCTPEYYPVSGWAKNWVEAAASLCGVDDGLPHRVARLEALGDSQVPQQIFPILRGIAMIECGEILQNTLR